MAAVVIENHNIIEQAVFGYANGHRLLRSTLELSANDNYGLAALSDMAPGVQIRGQESYLTGSWLSGGHYALIRTWLAQEMPRPGCVWSHVLLIPGSVMSTQVDLTPLLSLFRRPHEYKTDEDFTRRLWIDKRPTDIPAPDARLVELVLRAAYQSISVDASKVDAAQWERAILSVWSQQWPRLRRRFVFRSVPSSYKLRGQSIAYAERGRHSAPAASGDWIDVAVDDAVSRAVTPLQRFLWRYGKDIDSTDNAFADLVEIMTDERNAGPDTVAERVFRRFGAGDAETLKGDLLGAGGKLSQVGEISQSALASLRKMGLVSVPPSPSEPFP
jgi:hypothetical protein